MTATALFLQVGPPGFMPPPGPEAPPVRVVTEVHETHEHNLIAPQMDTEAVAAASVDSSRAVIVQVIAPLPVQWANELLSLPDIWRTTPPEWSYDNPAVKQMSEITRNVAMALLALVIFANGLSRALGQGDSFARPLYGLVLSMGTLTWWEIGIRLNNAICAAIGAPNVPSLIRPRITFPLDPLENVSDVVLVVGYAIAALLVLGSLVFRLGTIMVLIPTGFIALLTKGVEVADGFAQTYGRLATGVLFSQIMYVIGFRLVEVLGALGAGIAGTLVGLIILFSMRKYPSMLVSGLNNSGGRSLGGRIVQTAIMRRLPIR